MRRSTDKKSDEWAGHGLLRRYTAPQKWSVVFMSVLLLVSIAMALLEPNVVRAFIQAIQDGSPQQALVLIAIGYLAVSGTRQAMKALATYWSERVGWTATNQLRGDLMTHVLRLDLGFHASRSPGELIERIDGDVNGINKFFSSFVVDVVGNLLLLIGILVALTLVDPRIGLCFAGLTIVGMFVLIHASRVGTPLWKANRQKSALFYGELSEVLRATEDLRALGAGQHALSQFRRRIREWLPVEVRAATRSTSVWVGTIVLFTSATVLAYGIGGALFSGKQVSLSELYLVAAFALMLMEPMETIRNQLHYLQQSAAALSRIRELFGTRSQLTDGTVELPAGPLSLEFSRVRFAYRRDEAEAGPDSDRAVLPDLSFHLPAGHTLGLVGRTGAGKSTVGNLVVRHYDPQSGTVRLNGHDLCDLRLASLRDRIGLITQDVHIFSASLRDNLTFFDDVVDDDQLVTVLGTLGLSEWLARQPVGLDTMISENTLSAGEAQLIASARVFLKDPGLLVLDEPSSRLDPATQALVQRAMEVLMDGRTAILIAHRMETLRRVDSILVIDDGRILEHGPTAELLDDYQSRFATLIRAEEIST